MKTKYEKFVDENCLVRDNTDYLLAGLMEECGEVMQLRRKQLRGREISNKEYLDELGDTFWYLTALVNHFGYSLEDMKRTNMEKLICKRKSGR